MSSSTNTFLAVFLRAGPLLHSRKAQRLDPQRLVIPPRCRHVFSVLGRHVAETENAGPVQGIFCPVGDGVRADLGYRSPFLPTPQSLSLFAEARGVYTCVYKKLLGWNCQCIHYLSWLRCDSVMGSGMMWRSKAIYQESQSSGC